MNFLQKSYGIEKKEEEETRKKKKEWEDTITLIKNEAKSEADEIIAKALKEKEQLEAELDRLKNQTAVLSSPEARLTLQDIEYPHYWVKGQKNSFERYEVFEGTPEYDELINTWFSTLGRVKSTPKKGWGWGGFIPNTGTQVNKVYRNQNKNLWSWFYLKKKDIAARNGGNAHETVLYHGSRANACDIILRDGFDIRVAAMTGAIGAGIYFATHSSTSTGYCTAAHGYMQMMVCRVILGDCTPGRSGLRRPPPKNASKPDILYDSVSGSGMYVVFDNYQAYPEYLIEFKLQ